MTQFQLDPNYFLQVGLDSGALTIRAAIVHSLQEPGAYRGTVRRNKVAEAAFYISADSNSAVAQVTIDLASLVPGVPQKEEKDCCKDDYKNHFVVNPKGYVVFRVSSGPGGYNVHLRRAVEDPKTKVFDSTQLEDGDIFTGFIIRPGRYSLTNVITKAEGEITVSYPEIGKTAYRPPAPYSVDCTREGFKPAKFELQPAQGINFQIKTPSRIKVDLVEPYDRPREARERLRRGFQRRKVEDLRAKRASK